MIDLRAEAELLQYLNGNTQPEFSTIPSLQSSMNADLVSNQQGEFCIFHDQPLLTRLEYVEFDQGKGILNLILRWGIIQPFGEIIPIEYREDLASQDYIYLVWGQDGQFMDLYKAKLLLADHEKEKEQEPN